jgi:hypothetical protein
MFPPQQQQDNASFIYDLYAVSVRSLNEKKKKRERKKKANHKHFTLPPLIEPLRYIIWWTL